LLVEVNGASGLGKESKKLQVWKYLLPRAQQLQRFDVRGLSIINHERNIPPLDRQNKTPFQKDVLINAEEHKVGLLTTWDLYRLTRSFLKNSWRHEDVKDLFYRSGRIEPIPGHYEYLGTLQRYIEERGLAGIQIDSGELKKGDRIAFELPVEFEEQEVTSLQVSNEPVESATVGALAGIETQLTKEQAKKGTRVFRIIALGEKSDAIQAA
jgi:hypothetical protein